MSEENTLPPGIEMKSEATYPGVLSKVGHTIADTVVTGVAGGVVGAAVGAVGGTIIGNNLFTEHGRGEIAELISSPALQVPKSIAASLVGSAIGATIGATGGKNAAPVIGDHVFIGSGAKLIGDIQIADRICIGAGSVVVSSFTAPGITIAGVPARKISDNPSDSNLAPGLF